MAHIQLNISLMRFDVDDNNRFNDIEISDCL